MYSSSHNYVSSLIDEIALEGLDGITLEALWLRLRNRPNFKCALDESSKVFFWNIIRRLHEIQMYMLPEPRNPLVIFNRYDYIDPDLGIILEPDFIPEDIYPHHPVEDLKKNIRGSCKTYNKRKNVTKLARTLSLNDALEQWGARLVLVAKQETRTNALMGQNVSPVLEMKVMQYCILERIGRSRYLGEVTSGKVSLQVVGEDPKTLFYHRKFLLKHNLVVKQVHHQKTGSQNCSASLLHLPRFHVERKPKAFYLMERILEILKRRPNCIAEYDEIRRELNVSISLKKLFRTYDVCRFVNTDLILPYRAMYPEASRAEWKHKGSEKEKRIRAIQLVNPHMDVREIWARDEELDEEEDTSTAGLLDHSDLLLDRSILTQAYFAVKSAGPEGLSQMELSAKLGVSKLHARTLCRNMLKKGAVCTFRDDVGRQRICRYMAKKFEKEGKMNIEFMKEKERMLTLVGDKKKRKKTKSESKTQKTSSSAAEKAELLDNVEQTSTNEEGSEEPVTKKLKTEVSDHQTVVDEQQEVILQENSAVEKEVTNAKQNIEAEVLEGICTTKVKISHSSFTEELMKSDSKQGEVPNITYRLLKRANLIIEAVRKHRVIDDLTKILKHLKEEEEKEGYNVKIDKKSLLRLLAKLSKDGHLKVIKIILKNAAKQKMLSFVCEPDITTDHTVIQSAVEQAKMKFFILDKEKINQFEDEAKEKENSFPSEEIDKSMNELKTIASRDKRNKINFAHDSRIGRKYGFAPKFLRMQILHQFFFYLIYSYTGEDNLDQEAVKKNLKGKDDLITDEDLTDLPKVYNEDLDWKMFIPPLTKHVGWPEGWAIMCDLLLRIPLSVFVKVVNVSYVIPELQTYLQHPVRRNYLLRHLPSRICNVLMVARRYIFTIHEVMQRLCYIGLIQFGPQRLKEKDQVFIYLNRRTTLLDTTTSKPGYHQISDDVNYVEHKYEFHNLADLEKYWYEMWNICIHTQLGGRMHVTGKDIVLEVLQNKQAMIDAIQPRMPEVASTLDTGEVPGDKRGAAGLDSAFFSHLKRNWNWNSQVKESDPVFTNKVPVPPKPKVIEQRKARLASLKSDPISFVEIFRKQAKPVGKKSAKSASVAKKTVSRKTEMKQVDIQPRKAANKKKIIRRVLPRKVSHTHKPYYDDVDKKALQLMSKLRVEWSPVEDNLLLLCKIATMYLCPHSRKQLITFQMIRDYLHEICPAAHNKTSRACQRRILYMLKNTTTAHSVALHLEDVRQDPDIVKQFSHSIQQLQAKTDNPEEQEKQVNDVFKSLVKVLQRKFNPEPSDSPQVRHIPETMSEFRKEYEIVYPSTIKCRGRFKEIKNVVDIYCAVVNAIIFSSLCCAMDKTSYTYQLFQVYQQYPDNLLRSAMAKIRADQMVSLKKNYLSLKQKTRNFLPVSSSPYQLSISYLYQLQTRYQYEIFHNSYLMSKELCLWYAESQLGRMNSDQGLEAVASNGGMAAALIELFTRKQISFEIKIPEQIVILDPRVSEKDETYARIVQRYRDILQSCKTGKDSHSASIILRQQYINLVEPKDVISKENVPSTSGEGVGDTEFGDIEDDDDDIDTAEDDAKTNMQTAAIARAASRLALYMMREELGDSMVGEKQHAHDFFVVNSCKVYCQIRKPTDKSLKIDLYNKENVSQTQESWKEYGDVSENDGIISSNEADSEKQDRMDDTGSSVDQSVEPTLSHVKQNEVTDPCNSKQVSVIVRNENILNCGNSDVPSSNILPAAVEAVKKTHSPLENLQDVTAEGVIIPMDIVEDECRVSQISHHGVIQETISVVKQVLETDDNKTQIIEDNKTMEDDIVAMDVVEDEPSIMQNIHNDVIQETVPIPKQVLETADDKAKIIKDNKTQEGVIVVATDVVDDRLNLTQSTHQNVVQETLPLNKQVLETDDCEAQSTNGSETREDLAVDIIEDTCSLPQRTQHEVIPESLPVARQVLEADSNEIQIIKSTETQGVIVAMDLVEDGCSVTEITHHDNLQKTEPSLHQMFESDRSKSTSILKQTNPQEDISIAMDAIDNGNNEVPSLQKDISEESVLGIRTLEHSRNETQNMKHVVTRETIKSFDTDIVDSSKIQDSLIHESVSADEQNVDTYCNEAQSHKADDSALVSMDVVEATSGDTQRSSDSSVKEDISICGQVVKVGHSDVQIKENPNQKSVVSDAGHSHAESGMNNTIQASISQQIVITNNSKTQVVQDNATQECGSEVMNLNEAISSEFISAGGSVNSELVCAVKRSGETQTVQDEEIQNITKEHVTTNNTAIQIVQGETVKEDLPVAGKEIKTFPGKDKIEQDDSTQEVELVHTEMQESKDSFIQERSCETGMELDRSDATEEQNIQTLTPDVDAAIELSDSNPEKAKCTERKLENVQSGKPKMSETDVINVEGEISKKTKVRLTDTKSEGKVDKTELELTSVSSERANETESEPTVVESKQTEEADEQQTNVEFEKTEDNETEISFAKPKKMNKTKVADKGKKRKRDHSDVTESDAKLHKEDASSIKTDDSDDELPPLHDNFNKFMCDELLPLTHQRAKEVFDHICRNVVVSERDVMTEEEVQLLFQDAGATDADWKKARDIIDFAIRKKEIGAIMKELRKTFRKPRTQKSLAEILALLTESRIVYRLGVTSVHYVYHKFLKPWIVHSYKFLRADREKNPFPLVQKSIAYIDVDDKESADKQTGKTHEKLRAWRKRRLLPSDRQVEKAVQNVNLSQSEKIRITIRPWVRVDGTVNRRVLDRMLGSVLGYSMYMPGISIKSIAEHFTPALQPFQVREFIEILEMLGCVKLSVVKQPFKTSLFSKPAPVKITPADGTEDESKIVVNPQPDAVLRLGQFIGDKSYSIDFLATDANNYDPKPNVPTKLKGRASTSSEAVAK